MNRAPRLSERDGRTFAALALLCLASGAALWPALGAGFVYDDHLYLVGNPAVAEGLSLPSLAWAFTTFHAANWHPLTWVSHLLDVSLFGLDPRGHHAVSLALHAVNACVLFLVLRAATGSGGRSLVVAALFAVHPLHVESAAWVAERKDLVSTLFWLLAVGAWVRHARRPGPRPLAAAAALFALALLAKPMPLTLPALLLLLEIWPLGRLPLFRGFPGPDGRRAWRRSLLELLPLAVLSVGSAAVTLAAQHAGGATLAMERIPLGARAANALLSLAAYLRQALWPTGLAAFYPHPGPGVSLPAAAAAGAGLVAASVAAFSQARRRPHLALGWAWFLVTLLPVLGLVQVGEQARADRYTYVPLIGVFVAVVWAAGAAVSGSARARRAAAALAAAAVVLFAAAAMRQATFWQDDVALFGRALAVTRDNWVVRTNLGTALSWRGRHEEAIGHLRAAVALQPAAAPAWHGLGMADVRAGRLAQAEVALRRALRLRPAQPETMTTLGEVLARQGKVAEAAATLRRSVELHPGQPRAAFALGALAAARGQAGEAAELYRRALRLQPRFPEAAWALALALEAGGDRRGAAQAVRETLRLDPSHADARRAASAFGIQVDNPATGP